MSSDPCPTPPGPTTDGCVVSGRLSRLQANGNVMTGPEQVLVEDWCQQYPSHTIGTVAFGADGKLWVSGGEGASFNFADYGQGAAGGTSAGYNVCGDPGSDPFVKPNPPTAEGGSLRSQDLRTISSGGGGASGPPPTSGGSGSAEYSTLRCRSWLTARRSRVRARASPGPSRLSYAPSSAFSRTDRPISRATSGKT